MPSLNCGAGDGFQLVQLGTIDNPSGCEPNGYGSFLDQSTILVQGEAYNLTVTTGYGNQFVRVWIDFNDNGTFELDEIIVDNYEIADGQGPGSYTEVISLTIPASGAVGTHVLRVKSHWNNPVPDDACDSNGDGETEDYTVIIDFADAINNIALIDGDMEIAYLPGDRYKVSLTPTNFNERLIITVHDVTGRKMIVNEVENIGGTYTYDIDMSFAPAGVYLVRLGTDTFSKIKRIVVK